MSAQSVTVGRGGEKAWYLLIAGLVLIVDQMTKFWVATALQTDGELVVIRGFMNFSYTENRGIAFGMLNTGNIKWLLVAVSLVAISVVIFYLTRTALNNRVLLISLALLAGGISGNLIDRIRMGRVVDFIELYHNGHSWPVFNIADTAISIGAVLLAIDLFRSNRDSGSGSTRKATDLEVHQIASATSDEPPRGAEHVDTA